MAEVLGLVLSAVLGVWLLRSGDRRAWLCLTAVAAIAAMLAVFALEIQPINIAAAAASRTPPADWRGLRDRWSLDQTVCFGLALVALPRPVDRGDRASPRGLSGGTGRAQAGPSPWRLSSRLRHGEPGLITNDSQMPI